jgi:acyl carrier protein
MSGTDIRPLPVHEALVVLESKIGGRWGMASDVTISERIRSTLATFLKQDVDTIKLHQSLRNDLGLNSVDTFELVFELEEAFNFEIPDQDFPKLTTVSEVIAYVEGRVRKLSTQTSR